MQSNLLVLNIKVINDINWILMSRISLICYNCFLTVLFSTRTTTVGLYRDLLRKLIIYVGYFLKSSSNKLMSCIFLQSVRNVTGALLYNKGRAFNCSFIKLINYSFACSFSLFKRLTTLKLMTDESDAVELSLSAPKALSWQTTKVEYPKMRCPVCIYFAQNRWL